MTFLAFFVLFTLLFLVAFAIVRQHDLFAAGMLLGIFSLLSASLFTVMDAVDVAFTEASVGAGISTVLFLGALALTKTRERPEFNRFEIMPLCVVVLTGAVLFYATFDMPRYGDPSAPIHQHPIVERYMESAKVEVGIPNIVTNVLASYRGYDTFGETTVIFTAAVGVLLLLGGRRPQKDEPAMITHVVVRVMAKLLIPFIMLFALYVQFHGDFGPGGGFQAGVIFAAGIILYTLLYGLPAAQRAFPPRVLEFLVALGVMIYGGTGLAAIAFGGNLLGYDVLSHDPEHGQHLGILLVELGVGTTVTAVMVTLFFQFAGRARSR